MAHWTSLALLSALAVSALSSPRPDEDEKYQIPSVGTGQRSQYYVLHGDGTYKYGYDTGEGAFESARLKPDGRLGGEFGYKDTEGQDVRLQYVAGAGGFEPRGSHIPDAHPDFYAAHAAARARPAFVDPLANTGRDASYGFEFSEDGLSRTEQSDADGTVRGSYSYIDEEGRQRTYTYTAGRETGFVIEGDDLPEAPEAPGATPAATRLSGSQAGRFSAFGQRTTGSSTYQASRPSTSTSTFRASTAPHASARTPSVSRFSQTHTPSITPSYTRTTVHRPSVSTSAFGARRPTTTTTGSQTRYTSTSASSGQRTRPYEQANTRSQVTADGGYNFAYETSSHSRAESGDKDNNVVGQFDFVAEDDGQRRAIEYEASSATGFIAEGAHIPIGPEVPGAPSGQPTGKIVPVQQVRFVDPLADTGTDASYNFAFDSDQYSRSETADADGNVQGRYTVVDDDGTRRTYQFRAGKGIGFETEEVAVSQGPRPAPRPTAVSSVSSAYTGTGGAFSAHRRPSTSTAFSTTGSAAATTSTHRATTGGAIKTYSASRTPSRLRPATSPTFPSATSAFSSSSAHRKPAFKSPFTPSSNQEVFPGFTLRQYDASDDRDKFGYVLKFD